MKVIRLHPRDNVAVALEDVAQGEVLSLDGAELTAAESVRRGHKLALSPIPAGEKIIKYGCAIGTAKADIPRGAWVHVHNAATGLSEGGAYRYDHKTYELPSVKPRTFRGYRRADGRAAIRNELGIVPTVGCVNSIAQPDGGRPRPDPQAAGRAGPPSQRRGRAGAGVGVRESDPGAV